MPNISPPQQWSLPGSYVYTNSSGTSTTSLGTVVKESGQRYRLSTTTSGYGEKRLKGQLPENYFIYNESRKTCRQGYVVVEGWDLLRKKWYLQSQHTGDLGPWNADAPPSFSAEMLGLRNEAVIKLREKMKEVDVDLAVLVGEGRETVRMLHDIGQRLIGLLSALRSKNPERFMKQLDFSGLRGGHPPKLPRDASAQAANLHLMYWYGVKPLLSDLFGLSKALEKGLRKVEYKMATSRSKAQNSVRGVSSYGIDAVLVWHLHAEVSTRAKYSVSDPVLATLADLGLTNPPATLWELTRLSFVFDWLIQVGSWLGQVDAGLGKTIHGSSVTTYKKVTGTIAFSRKGKLSGYSRETSAWSAVQETVSVERAPLNQGELPIALLPPIVPKLELFQALTTLALLRQDAFGLIKAFR